MAFQIKIANREINPRVINFFQYENQVTTLEFELDSYIYDEVDLRNYKAYAHSTINGVVDITELEMAYDADEDKLKLTWNVGDYTLTHEGGITYQIVFKQNADDGTGSAAWYSYNAVIINRGSVDSDHKVVAEFPTIMTQWLHKIDQLAESALSAIIYIDYGKDILAADRIEGRIYYRYLDAAHKSGQFEDHNKNVLTPELVAKNVEIDAIAGVEGNTVQAALESLQENIENKDSLPVQDGMNGRFLQTDGENAVWSEMPRHLPLFSPVWADHKLNDTSFLRADTFSWQSGDIYKSAYEHLLEDFSNAERRSVYAYGWSVEGGTDVKTLTATPEVGDPVYWASIIQGTVSSYDSSTNQITYIREDGSEYTGSRDAEEDTTYFFKEHTETIGSTEITFYKASDGHKIVLADQEENVSAIYAETGIAWYYILDTENKRFKLPRTKHAFTGLRNSVGNYVEAGLPNITGFISGVRSGAWAAEGAFKNTAHTSTTSQTMTNHLNQEDLTISLDASLSSDIYGNSDTVQPPATQMYLYFFVGNYSIPKTVVDIGALTETINDTKFVEIAQEIEEAKQAAIADIETAGEDVVHLQRLETISETAGTIALEANKIYTMSISDNVVFSLPTSVNSIYFNQIKVMAKITGTPVITWGTTYFMNKSAPELEEGAYDFYFDYDPNLAGWVVGAISKGA